MKKLALLFLLSIYLISTTELHQLIKLPFLVDHFIEHKTNNSAITFFEFLNKHYSSGALKDEDYTKDMKLPFKSSEGCPDNTINAPIAVLYNSLSIYPLNTNQKTFCFYNDMFLPSSFLPAIWQPPKSY